MSSVLQDWRLELIGAHPDLFRPSAGTGDGAEGLPECGPGWRDLIDRYWTGRRSPESSALVDEAIDLAEARSVCSCEICGEAGVLRTGGWLTTRCDLHAEERAPAEVRPGFENVHILRYGLGAQRQITGRRYDRETDAFVDVDAASLEIEED
ncbi:hypothetical protein RX327_33230 [Bradyrhizobium sp. BEA-2-5]|uniref:hypothetical protein n=1 Tax=Bradyrhizobium sp. BEA-2-5 TaxID=3080015 RepID=UPI00293F3AD2|nr:hypothetical protein [Bradyrhizobium sp. BEA-2-5]WOH80581.1 hypothetical protein RX327_33230 [Bradyrhizobium sp. BEA-2-5]